MAKYRKLSLEELKELEKEFINFLIVNGIDAKQWEGIKHTNVSLANELIATFSDFVLESIFKKATYIELRSSKSLRIFKFNMESLLEVGLSIPIESDGDFTNQDWVKNAFENPPTYLKTYCREDEYKKGREIEMFELTINGAVITDERLFEIIQEASQCY